MTAVGCNSAMYEKNVMAELRLYEIPDRFFSHIVR